MDFPIVMAVVDAISDEAKTGGALAAATAIVAGIRKAVRIFKESGALTDAIAEQLDHEIYHHIPYDREQRETAIYQEMWWRLGREPGQKYKEKIRRILNNG